MRAISLYFSSHTSRYSSSTIFGDGGGVIGTSDCVIHAGRLSTLRFIGAGGGDCGGLGCGLGGGTRERGGLYLQHFR